MPNQHQIVVSYKSEGGTSFIKDHTIDGDLSQNVEIDIPAGATNAQLNMSIPTSTLLSCGFAITKKTGQTAASVAGPVTIKTNSSSVPDNTLVLKTTQGICWSTGDDTVANPKPITVTVTTMYITNAGDAIASLVIRALNDSTPVLA